jgi:hypothetical protein
MTSSGQIYVTFLACALLIFVPIISVQIPRFFKYKKNTNNAKTKPTKRHRPPMLDGSDADVQPLRRPWDPPFPTTTNSTRKDSGWRILQSSAPKRTETLVEEGEGSGVEEPEQMRTVAATAIPRDDLHPIRNQHQPPKKENRRETSGLMSNLWTLLAILAGLLLFLFFVILTAHCLAWFIVYKTEARLGEARRGLVQGGEMRLCLCARG